MTDVFISYARAQAKLAAQAAERLAAEGFEVWWDSDLPAHRAYSDVIEERLAAAKAVLVIWSKTAAQSEWVRAEADVGRAAHKLVQASADGGLPPLPFNQIQVADLKGWSGGADDAQWRKVLASVEALVGAHDSAPGPVTAGKSLLARAAGALRARPRLAIGAGVAAAALLGLGAWMIAAAPAGAVSSSVEVGRIAPLQADAELQRLGVSASDTTLRYLTSGGLDARLPGAGNGQASLKVDGALDRAGDQLTIDARITSTRTGAVLWSGRFQGPAAKAQALADQAGFAIAVDLDCALLDQAAEGKAFNPSVMGLYIGACDGILGSHGPERMLSATRRLVAAAPNLAAGWAMHAIATARVAGSLNDREQAAALIAESRAASDRALRLNPRIPKAYLGRAVADLDEMRFAACEQDLQKALAIDPNLIPARIMYARLLGSTGRLREAVEVTERIADSSDPRAAGSRSLVAALYAQSGDLIRAGDLLRQAAADPLDEDAASTRWSVVTWWQPPAKGLAELRAAVPPDTSPEEVACIEAHLRLIDAGRLPAIGLPAACAPMPGQLKIRMLSRQGDVDGAYAAFAQWRGRWYSYFFYPEMAAFRRDRRFIAIARERGWAAYWRQSGHWPDFCADPGLTYDCRRDL